MNINKFTRLVDISYALFDPHHPVRTFHVSFIVKGSKILSIGINSPKTHTLHLRNKKHGRKGNDLSSIKKSCSELICLNRFKKISNIEFGKCSLINIRINGNQNLDNSRPCESCQSLLRWANFKNVFYTDNKGKWQEFIV